MEDHSSLVVSGNASPTLGGQSGFIQFARMGTAVADILSGSTLRNDPEGTTFIARFPGSEGTLNVRGTDSEFDGGNAIIVARQFDFGSNTTAGPGGTGVISASDGGLVAARTIEVYGGGALTGDGGTFSGEVNLIDGGLVSPGESIGELTFTDFTDLSDGILLLEVGSDAGTIITDRVLFQGGVEFGAGEVMLALLDGLAPGVFDSLKIQDFLFTDTAAIAPGLLADVSFTGIDGLFYDSVTGRFRVGVPEPSAWVLIVCALPLLAAARARHA